MTRQGASTEEGRELKRRLAEVRAGRRVSPSDVRRDVLHDLDRELRRRVRAYTGLGVEACELLEGLMIAHEVGLDCAEIEQQLARRLRKLKRAA
jgi:hypothetical protein